jgi:hypothetical protein
MKKLLIALFALLQFATTRAQFLCANDRFLEQLKANNVHSFDSILQANRLKWQHFRQLQNLAKEIIIGSDTVYEIPVVVHVMHTGGAVGTANNPSDASIVALINYLNQTWAASWPDYDAVSKGGTKFPFVFKLAKRDADCNTTSGINRVNASSLPGYTTYGVCPFGVYPGPSDRALKSLSIWPTYDYFNIWLVTQIEKGGAGGYCPWPWFTGSDLLDGAVVLSAYATPTSGVYDYALPHELGHGFGLYHTFQNGCHDPSDCLTMGDEVCDTEPHDYVDSRCTEGLTNPCTASTYAGVEHNFMNYTDCPRRFTPEQRTRTIFTMNEFRRGLVNSLGATAPVAGFAAPKTACLPAISFPASTQDVGPRSIMIGSMKTSSGGYNGDGNKAYLDRTCIQEAVALVGGVTYPIAVTTAGAVQSVSVWIDYNDDGVFQSTELIFSDRGTLSYEVHTGSFKVPATAVLNKNLRLRVKADNGTISGACDDVSEGQTEDYTAIISKAAQISEDDSKPVLTFSPNPAASHLHIEASGPVSSAIYGMDGRLIKDLAQTRDADISEIPAGIYLITAKQDQQVVSMEKLVIIR